MLTGETKTIWSLESPIRITVCKIDQFDRKNEIGFGSEQVYYEGKTTNGSVLSWNGLEGNLTANETIQNLFVSTRELVLFMSLDGPTGNTTTVLPYGQCKHIQGLPQHLLDTYTSNKNVLRIYIRNMLIDSVYKVFVSDPAAAPKFQLPKPLLIGDRIEAITVNRSTVFYYNLMLKETRMELDDGSCVDYPDAAGHDSYADCVEEENQRKILPVLGCMPPWLSEMTPCKEPIFMFEKQKPVQKWIGSIYRKSKTGFHYGAESCLLPCTQISVQAIFQDVKHYSFSSRLKFDLFFDEMVKVERVVLAYGVVDLLVEVGSCLGLWLGLSVVGIFDIIVLVIVKLRNIKENMFFG